MAVTVTQANFGAPYEGKQAILYTLDNGTIKAAFTNWGASIVSIWAPDKNGNPVDVALGFSSGADYANQHSSIGVVPGRCANRIRAGKFTLNGQQYTLYCNNGANHLHGGKNGFGKRFWEAEVVGESIRFTLFSPHMDEGYPGNLTVSVTYSLTEDNGVSMVYDGITDQDTVLNLTNHCYFNLSGHQVPSILDHILTLNASRFTEADEGLITTGVITPTQGTPMDFTTPHVIGERIHDNYTAIRNANGYDQNYVIDRQNGNLCFAAKLVSPATGIVMDTYTTAPGIQLYTSNSLKDELPGKDGVAYGQYHGVCLETQCFPNAIEYPHFPSPVLKAGERYRHETEYRFSVEK